MRKAAHLCVGARVMLTQNRLWGVGAVPLGLMNGARGIAAAILYSTPGAQRVDGSALAGSGFPSSRPGNYPIGMEACPLLDFVVVHFPDYAGPPCFDNFPKTWVPVLCVEVVHKNTKSGIIRAWGSHSDWRGLSRYTNLKASPRARASSPSPAPGPRLALAS